MVRKFYLVDSWIPWPILKTLYCIKSISTKNLVMEIICCIHINLTASNIDLAVVGSYYIDIITRGVISNDMDIFEPATCSIF